MGATIGTIPALPQYQPGALPIAGTEALEIVNTTVPSQAASYFMLLTDLVGKAPSVIPNTTPTSVDLVTFYQASSGLPRSCEIGAFGLTVGNLPVGGGTGQILAKNSGTNFDASWDSLSAFVVAGAGLFVTGSTTVTIGIATAGVGSTQIASAAVGSAQIATNAVGNIQLRQGAGLSVIGVTGNLLANEADIVGVTDQVLRVGTAGLTLAFGPVNLAAAVAVTGVLSGANMTAVNLATSGVGGVQNTLPVTNGGIGTATLIQNGVVFGNGSATVGITAAGATGTFLAGQSGAPAWVAGGLFLLNTIMTTSAMTISDLTSLSNGIYKNYLIAIDGLIPSVGTAQLQLRLAFGNSTTFQSSAYVATVITGIAGTVVAEPGSTYIPLTGSGATTAATDLGYSGEVRLYNQGSSQYNSVTAFGSGANGAVWQSGGVCQFTTNFPTGFELLAASGTVSVNAVKVYGF